MFLNLHGQNMIELRHKALTCARLTSTHSESFIISHTGELQKNSSKALYFPSVEKNLSVLPLKFRNTLRSLPLEKIFFSKRFQKFALLKLDLYTFSCRQKLINPKLMTNSQTPNSQKPRPTILVAKTYNLERESSLIANFWNTSLIEVKRTPVASINLVESR